MTGEKVDFDAVKSAANGGEKDKRDRSTIDFPYMNLEQALEVVDALYARSGLGPCDIDELAAQMGQTLSGAFRQKTAAAKTFGLVDKDGRSAFVLSELGRKAVEDNTKKAALVQAFLNVPLYDSVFNKYRGYSLPPAKALEREMEALGVASKQTDRARQAFERSAQFAGFFESGKDRLVKPRLENHTRASELPVDEQGAQTGGLQDVERNDRRGSGDGGGGGGGGGGQLPPNIDPIILGLINRLPKSGDSWPKAKRKLWLAILENSFDLVYEDHENGGDLKTDFP